MACPGVNFTFIFTFIIERKEFYTQIIPNM